MRITEAIFEEPERERLREEGGETVEVVVFRGDRTEIKDFGEQRRLNGSKEDTAALHA